MDTQQETAEKFQSLFELMLNEHDLILTISEMEDIIIVVQKVLKNMKKIKLFKVLNKDMTTRFQKFQMEIDKEYHCDDFYDDIKKDYSAGYYATGIEGLIYSFNISKRIFESEVWGKRVEIDLFKRRYENIKLIREILPDEIKKLAKKEESKLGYRLSEVLFPYNPLQYKGKVTDKEIELLNKWASVWASVKTSVGASIRGFVGASVRDSVGDSVWTSVKDSVWASVGHSVWDSIENSVGDSVWTSIGDSVWASIWAYLSSLFFNIKNGNM